MIIPNRSPLFMKEHKQYSLLSFFFPFIAIVVLGVVSSKNTKQVCGWDVALTVEELDYSH